MPYYAFALALALFVLYFLCRNALSFYKNLRAAQSSGIPYIVSPIYGYNRVWLITEALWTPILRRLPNFLTHPWIDVISGDWAWKARYTPFSTAGLNTNTFIIVSSAKNILCTAEAEVINQITTRRNDFPKPIEMYASLDVYGKNVVSVEGGEWRRQRRIMTPQFNEKSNAVVWKESLFQAGEMIRGWTDNTSETKGIVCTLGKDAMRLSLHVISRAGFDVRCLWPGAKLSEKECVDEGSMDSTTVPEG